MTRISEQEHDHDSTDPDPDAPPSSTTNDNGQMFNGTYDHAPANNNAADGPRKKQKLEGPRPMCTNCEQCQLRKGKCDGGRPVCGWCAANNKPCVYQEKKKPGLKAGYGRDLERRLTTLEESLGEREAELERTVRDLEERVRGHERVLEALQGLSRMGAGGSVGTNGLGSVSSPTAQGGTGGLHGMGMNAGMGLGSAATAPSPAASLHPSHHSHHSNASIKAASPYQTHQQPPGTGGSGPPIFASPGTSSHLSLHNPSNYNPPRFPVSNSSHTSHHRSQSSHHLPHPQSQAPTSPRDALAPPPPQPSSNSKFDDPSLPPFDLSFDLLQLYFDRINPWFPLLDRKSTLQSMVRQRDPEDEILLHAIIATTIRYYDRNAMHIWRPEYMTNREHYHSTSKRRVLLSAFDSPSIRSLQALVILALDMVGSQTGGPGMFLLASIARCATALGLTNETFSLSSHNSAQAPAYPSISTLRASALPEPHDFIEDESRRRLFWLIYALDIDTTITTALDFTLDSSLIDRKLPCSDTLFAANSPVETRWFPTPRRTDYSLDFPENLGALSYLIELKGLLSQIHVFLKRPVNIGERAEVETWRATYREIDCRLKSWRGGLPFEWRNTDQVLGLGDGGKAMGGGWVLLQMTYYTVFIRMHSSAAYPPYRTALFSPSPSAAHQCILAVEKIVALTRYVIRSSLISSQGPPFAFALWVSARVLLVHGSTIEKQVSTEVYFLIDTLEQLGGWWPVARRYAEILSRVMREYEDSLNMPASARESGREDGTGSGRTQPPSVAILADMRRCAYDLDTLISDEPLRHPPQTPYNTLSHLQPDPLNNGLALPNNNHLGNLKFPSISAGEAANGTTNPVLTELDYLETFNFFNYPRVGSADPNGAGVGFNAYYNVPSDAASQVGSMGGFGDLGGPGGGDWLSSHFS